MEILINKLDKIDTQLINDNNSIYLLNEYHKLKKEILEKEITSYDLRRMVSTFS